MWGDGRRVMFWHGLCCSDFSWAADDWEERDGVWCWNPCVLRTFHD